LRLPAASVQTEFQILEDATEQLRAPNAVHSNGTVSRLVLEDLGDEREREVLTLILHIKYLHLLILIGGCVVWRSF